MSNTDSFIDEVTEEVRRDRLFLMLRRYGWIGAVAVVAIVGGTAVREYSRAQQETAAQSLGDAMIAALEPVEAADRASALAEVTTEGVDGQMLVDMARAGSLVDAGDTQAAIPLYQAIGSNGDLPVVYRHIASFKALVLQSDTLSVDERRLQFNALAAPGAPLEYLAREQLALLEVESGDAEAAIALLRTLVEDANASVDVRDRANQLIVALGGGASAPSEHGG